MKATVNYRGAQAFFSIRKEDAGIFYADLLSYEGDLKNAPPLKITLIKGVRRWTGSCDDKILLNELGEVIASGFRLPA